MREGGRKGSWWETNKLSIQLLVASNTHGALNHHRQSCVCVLNDQITKVTFCCNLSVRFQF